MKAIIEGKRYDTETSELIAEFWNGDRGSFKHFKEALYRTPKGAWFLACRGNALSPYADVFEQSRGPGEELRPLSEDEVRHWMERTKKYDSIEEYFPDHIEDA